LYKYTAAAAEQEDLVDNLPAELQPPGLKLSELKDLSSHLKTIFTVQAQRVGHELAHAQNISVYDLRDLMQAAEANGTGKFMSPSARDMLFASPTIRLCQKKVLSQPGAEPGIKTAEEIVACGQRTKKPWLNAMIGSLLLVAALGFGGPLAAARLERSIKRHEEGETPAPGNTVTPVTPVGIEEISTSTQQDITVRKPLRLRL
jgi:hypothetical protein